MPRKISKVIEKKDYYSIGEVAAITEIATYVLRFWETEFNELKPSKNYKGHRYYTNEDIEIAKIIKKLMHEEKYTLEGARKKIKEILSNKESINANNQKQIELLKKIKERLIDILTLLDKNSINDK